MASRKTAGSARRSRHADLEGALLASGMELVRKLGHASLSIREVARRTGVSHTAAHYHFQTRERLLGALAAKGFGATTQALEVAVAESPPGERMGRLGRAYVREALRDPGMYRLMFSAETADRTIHPELAAAAQGLFAVLASSLEGPSPHRVTRGSGGRDLALAAWSLVHGLAALLLDRQATSLGDGETDVEALVDRVLASVTFEMPSRKKK